MCSSDLAAAQSDLTVVDAGHFKTEQIIVERLAEQLSARFPGIAVTQSLTCTDGVRYL